MVAVCPLCCPLPYKSGVGGRNQLHKKAGKTHLTKPVLSCACILHPACGQGKVRLFLPFETCEPSADALRTFAQAKKGSCSRILLGWPFFL